MSDPCLYHEGVQPDSCEVCLLSIDPGESELLTLRSLRLMQKADVVVYDGSISRDILDFIRSGAEQYSVGETRDDHAFTPQEINQLLVKHARAGKRVLRLKAVEHIALRHSGDEIETLIAADIPFQVVPRVNAAKDRSTYAEITLPYREIKDVFSAADRNCLYKIIAARRDMRHFLPGKSLDNETITRLLSAAHQAPSVGLMQPWRFIRVTDVALRESVASLVAAERDATAVALGDRSAEFLRLKIEGIRECAELLVVALAPDDGTVFGRRTLPDEMALCSVACAIQNLWLAARAENLGLGWVSMFDPAELARLLDMPAESKPIAILCLGPVKSFYSRPMLEQENWRHGRSLDDMIFENYWGDITQQFEIPA